MVERDAFGPGSSGTAPGQADGEDGGSADGLTAAGDGLDVAGGNVMAGDGRGADGEDERVAQTPDVDEGGALAGLDDAFSGGDSGVADLYELRLTALLHQLVRRRGHKGAARELGVNPRTVAGSVKQGMSRRVREALERMLVDRDGAARDRLEDEMEGVKVEVSGGNERVTVLEKRAAGGPARPGGAAGPGDAASGAQDRPGGGREGWRERRFLSGCHTPGAGCGITVAAALPRAGYHCTCR